LDPLDITPVGATTGRADSQEFSTLFKKQYKDAKVVSVGWQGNPDLDKIAELKPDLILMTGEQEDLYEELSEIAPTVGYQINTDENWDYHETSLKVAEIFDKRDEMKKDLDRVDAREAVFAENVKAKFGNQKLMYLRVTDNDIRYYAYGHFGYLYDTYHFNRAETFNPDDMFQVIDPDKLKDINPDLLIVQADSQELLDNKLKNNPVWSSLKAVQNNKVIYADYSTYMLGFGIVSQEAIMKQISDEWGLN
jgi:iron complex transport system substrate-binding protein